MPMFVFMPSGFVLSWPKRRLKDAISARSLCPGSHRSSWAKTNPSPTTTCSTWTPSRKPFTAIALRSWSKAASRDTTPPSLRMARSVTRPFPTHTHTRYREVWIHNIYLMGICQKGNAASAVSWRVLTCFQAPRFCTGTGVLALKLCQPFKAKSVHSVALQEFNTLFYPSSQKMCFFLFTTLHFSLVAGELALQWLKKRQYTSTILCNTDFCFSFTHNEMTFQ